MIFFGSLLFLLFVYLFYSLMDSLQSPNQKLCKADECAIGIDGIKRCPPTGERVNLQPGEECTLQYACTASSYPYGVWADGSVQYGKCPPNISCNCVRSARCPEYISSAWKSVGSSNVLSTRNYTRQVLTQTDPPDKLGANTYCAIPPAWTIYGVPGCPTDGEFTLNKFQACMQDDAVCQNGTLVFLPEKIEDVYLNPLLTPVGCVYGPTKSCPQRLRAWDNQRGEIVCV